MNYVCKKQSYMETTITLKPTIKGRGKIFIFSFIWLIFMFVLPAKADIQEAPFSVKFQDAYGNQIEQACEGDQIFVVLEGLVNSTPGSASNIKVDIELYLDNVFLETISQTQYPPVVPPLEFIIPYTVSNSGFLCGKGFVYSQTPPSQTWVLLGSNNIDPATCITLLSPPELQAINGPTQLCYGSSFTFSTANQQEGVNYCWSIISQDITQGCGDNNISNIFQVFDMLPPGNYTVMLKLVNECGQIDVIKNFTILPVANTIITNMYCKQVQLEPELMCFEENFVYLWTLNGSLEFTSAQTYPTFNFPIDGTYNGNLLITAPNEFGGMSVIANIPFSVTTGYCCEGEFYTFNDGTTASQIINTIGSNVLTTNSLVAFNGVIYIDTDFSISYCPEIKMAKDAIFKVGEGVRFTIDHSTIDACSNYMWKGITTESLAKVDISNSEIRNAFNVISTVYNTFISCVNNNFKNNAYCFDLSNQSNSINFYGNTIQKTTNLLPPIANVNFRGVGMTFRNCVPQKIGDEVGNRNLFLNQNAGLIFETTSFDVLNCKFDNITSLGSTLGQAIFATSPGNGKTYTAKVARYDDVVNVPANNKINEFENCTVGICIEKTNQHVLVYGNSFDNITGTAIEINKCKNSTLDVLFNNIDNLQRNGIVFSGNQKCVKNIKNNSLMYESNGSPSRVGITVSNIYLSTIADDFTTVSQNYVNNSTRGIVFMNCFEPQVYSNAVTLTNASNLLFIPQLDMAGLRFSNCTGVRAFDNFVNGSNSGLTTVNEMKIKGIDIQFSSVRTLSCDSIINCGWGISAKGSCIGSRIQKNSMDDCDKGIVVYDGGILGAQGSPQNVNFGGRANDNKWWTNIESHLYAYGTQQSPTDGFNTNFYLRGIQPNNSVNPNPFLFSNSNSTIVNSILYSELTTPVNLYTACQFSNWEEYEIKYLGKFVQTDTTLTEGQQSWNKEQVYTELVQAPVLRAYSAVLDSFFIAHTNSSVNLVNTYWSELTIKDTNSTLSNNRIAALQERENQLSNLGNADNLHEENLRTLAGIYRATFTENIDTLTPNQMLQVEYIAQQCAMQGGPSVYVARSMRWAANGMVDYDYDDACVAQTGSNKMAQTNKNAALDRNCPYSIHNQLGNVVLTTEKQLEVQIINNLGQLIESFNFTGTKVLNRNSDKICVLRIFDKSTNQVCSEKVIY